MLSRNTIAILSTENLRHNAQVLQSHAPDKELMVMVKANAYGHGLRSVAQRLDGLVPRFGVASIEEALALRAAGVRAPITLMQGPFNSRDIVLAAVEDFALVLHHWQQIQWLQQIRLPRPVSVWLKINIGMSRLGFELDDAERCLALLSQLPQVAQPVNLMGHFSHADMNDPQSIATTEHQLQLFDDFASSASSLIGKKSLSNSAGLLRYPKAHFDVLRPGLTVYGVSPFEDSVGADFGLKPVMTLQSALISIALRPQGARVGYGGIYTCPERMPVGVVAFGYGDGFPVQCQQAVVRIGHALCPIIGKVSMDMMAVDLRPASGAHVGDDVLLWGEDLPVERLAQDTNNMPWSLLTQIQNRVKFLWTPK